MFSGFHQFLQTIHQGLQQGGRASDQPDVPQDQILLVEEAERAFNLLKLLFSTAPMLVQPNPQRQFMVEVDASNVGAGAVLSQWAEDCRGCTPAPVAAEKNYDVGNPELLVVKLALEEGHHWLEGTEQPFCCVEI